MGKQFVSKYPCNVTHSTDICVGMLVVLVQQTLSIDLPRVRTTQTKNSSNNTLFWRRRGLNLLPFVCKVDATTVAPDLCSTHKQNYRIRF